MTDVLGLKPCPFCGRKPEVINAEFESGKPTRLLIRCCMEFDIETPMLYTHNIGIQYDLSPIEKWNRRVGVDAQNKDTNC